MSPTAPLTGRALDRTLLLRQGLLRRAYADPVDVVAHLVGLQAQDNLPPYLALAARIEDFDPRSLSAAIDERRAVRLLTMRGTVHVLAADDALTLRRWTQPALDRQAGSNAGSRPAAHLAGPALREEVLDLVHDGPLPLARLGELLALAHPDVPAAALGHVTRELAPLVQVPPRGLWRRSGGVVYADVERWLGAPQREPDVPGLVLRYLRAFGPARAADVTTWSGVTRLGPILADMAGQLDEHEGPGGRTLYDAPGAPLAIDDVPAPVRLLGTYDNLWLSHADRDRVLAPADRPRWSGPNGGRGNLLLAGGAAAGLWATGGPSGHEVQVEPWRRLTRAERSELDEEVERVQRLLATPAYVER